MHGLTFATKLEAGGTRRLKTIATIIAAALLVAGCEGAKVRVDDNPKKQGPAQKVHLIWKQATNEWKVKLNNDPQEKDPKTAKTTLIKGTGPTMFVVDIQGSNPKPTFKDQDPLAVWTGSKSAPQSGVNSTQILGPVVTKQGDLVFWDLNQGDPVTLNYGFYFNENGVPPVDPIIENGGGDRQ